jgi:hypothetical protein
MIDLIVNTIMILGITLVSVPTLLFAFTGVAHVIYALYNLVLQKISIETVDLGVKE